MTRVLLGVSGLALMLVGAVELARRAASDLPGLVSAVLWLAGGVVAHDFVLAPLVVLAGLLGARLLPAPARAPAAVGLVLLGTVTLAVLPNLTRFGAKPDNPSLLDLPYGPLWCGFAGLVLAGVVAASVVRARRRA